MSEQPMQPAQGQSLQQTSLSTTVPAGSTPVDTTPQWLSSLSDDSLKTDPTLMRFKDPTDLAKSYVEGRKKYGDPDRLIQIPKDGEAWDGVWEKLGRPKNHEEYEFEYAEGVAGDEKYENDYKKMLHEAGLPKGTVKQISKNFTALEKKRQDALMDAFRNEKLEGFKDLNSRVGDKEVEFDSKGASAFNKLNERMGGKLKEVFDRFSLADHPVIYELFGIIGMDNSPDSPPTGSSVGISDKSLAAAEIEKLKSDPDFMAKINKGEATANEIMRNLYKKAHN